MKVSGIPMRRVNQRYVIATTTKLDISSVKIPGKLDDAYFKRKKLRTGKRSKNIFDDKKEVRIQKLDNQLPGSYCWFWWKERPMHLLWGPCVVILNGGCEQEFQVIRGFLKSLKNFNREYIVKVRVQEATTKANWTRNMVAKSWPPVYEFTVVLNLVFSVTGSGMVVDSLH